MKPTVLIGTLTFGCLTSLLPVHAQEPVAIPDPHLATAVRVALGLPAGTPVTSDLMLNLQQVTVRGMVCFDDDDDDDDDDDSGGCIIQPVRNLTGLEHAHNLTTLWLSGPEHDITDLEPIKGLTRLKELTLPNALKVTGDELESATEVIGGLGSLTTLNLALDGLEDRHLVPLAPLAELTFMDLSNNQLTDIGPLRGMVRLQSLNLFNNRVNDLSPLRGLTRLEWLEFGLNPIVDLSPLAGMQRLSGLAFAGMERDLHSLPPLRRIRSITTNAPDLGPLARLDQLQSLSLLRAVADLTPLANLEQLTLLSIGTSAIEDLTPLRLATAFRPTASNNGWADISWFATIDLTTSANAAVLDQWYRSGALPRGGVLPQNQLWKRDHFIPDGVLRNFLSVSLGVPSDQLQPSDLETGLATDGMPLRYVGGVSRLRSLEGLQHAASLEILSSVGGWIVDLAPLGALPLTDARLELWDNRINDVTPLIGKPFASLDLRDNPINPATVPESWWTDSRIQLDPRRVLSPQEAIPDEGLRAAIRIALSLAPSAPVTAADVQRLEYLYAEGHRIESLAGLEVATQLKGLALRNNVIASLTPVAHVPSLRWLRVSGNVLDATAPAVIASLRARGVRVDDHEAGRFLSAITPVNGVVYADTYQLSSLRYLQLFPAVRELFLSGNHLRDIDLLGSLRQLERVHLDGNLLRLEAGTPTRATLDALVARGVAVTVEPQRPEAGMGLPLPDEALHRAIADAAELPVVPAGFTQAQLEAVTDLDWERTFPVVRPPLTHPDLLRQLPNLTRLSLENASLKEVGFVASLPKLTSLDLDFNAITDLSPLEGLTSLIELDVNNNQLTDVTPLASLTALEKLDLDQNGILDISALAPLVKLTEIDLHSNKVSDLTPLAPLTALRVLDLKDNQIRNVASLSGLTSLSHLDLENNSVATLAPLSTLTALVELKLEYNGITLNEEEMAVVNGLYLAAPGVDIDLRPQFSSSPQLVFSEEGMSLEWWSEPNVWYMVLSSDDMVTWGYVEGFPGVGGPVTISLPPEAKPSKFYRVTP